MDSRFRLAALLTLLAAPAYGEDCPSPSPPAVAVTAVPDARTVTLADGRRIQPAGLESFALFQPGSADADEALAAGLRALLTGSSVNILPTSAKTDRHGRLPALLFLLADGRLVQEAAAAEGVGIAWTAEASLPCFGRIVAAEAEARRGGVGRWSGEMAHLPDATPAALQPFVGSFAIFEGKVVTVGARPQRTYLNFGGRWTEDVTVTVSSRDREAFGGDEVLKALAGRRVRVRGFVEDHGGPAVTLQTPAQLEVLPVSAGSVAEKP